MSNDKDPSSLGKDMMNKAGDQGKKMAKNAANKAGRAMGKKIGKAVVKGAQMLMKALIQGLIKLAVFLGPWILFGIICVSFLAIGFTMLFETRGTQQNYTIATNTQNKLEKQDGGNFIASDLSGQNNSIQQFYNYFGSISFYQILGNDNSKLEQDSKIRDYYKREEQFNINSNLLFSLDEILFNRKMKYPEQFIKPLNYDVDKFTLKPLTNDKLQVVVESIIRDDKGLLTKKKELGIQDYGLGSIYKYKEDNRTLKVEGDYYQQDVWNETTQTITQKKISGKFTETMKGYPQKIYLITDALTFAGKFSWTFSNNRKEFSPLKEGVGEENSDKIKIQYGTATEYEFYPCTTDVIKDVIAPGNTNQETDPNATTTKECKRVKATHPLYKYRSGYVYEYVPSPANQTYENAKGVYFEGYVANFKAYVPNSVMTDFKFDDRVGQTVSTNFEIGKNASLNNANFANSIAYEQYAKKYGPVYGVDPYLIIALISQESGGYAKSKSGGLGQISGGSETRSVTAKNVISGQSETFAVRSIADRENPEISIHWITMKLASKIALHKGDVLKGLQAYNADLASYISDKHPEAYETMDWLSYREEARDYYGSKELGVPTKSVSYNCMPALQKDKSFTTYGDVCYLEHVLAYYKGDKFKSIEAHDGQSNWETLVSSVASMFSPTYKEDEPHSLFEFHATGNSANIILNLTTAMENKTSYSDTAKQNLSFWDEEFITSFDVQDLDYTEFMQLVPNIKGYSPPLAIKNPRVSSVYGPRIRPTAGASKFHEGIDLAVPLGTPVYSVNDGIVSVRGFNNIEGYNVRIRHADGNISLYKHLSKFGNIEVGSEVKRGELIGLVGTTGASTGPHLHFGFSINGKLVNPYFIAIQPDAFKED